MSEWLTVKEVAAMYEVNEATVGRWIHNGHLVAYKVGGRYRIKREDARAAMARVEPSYPARNADKARRQQELEDVIRKLEDLGYTVS